MKRTLLSVLLAALALMRVAAQPFPDGSTVLFDTQSSPAPYRIPAIVALPGGTLLALSDYRPCGADIGYGHVDIVGRRSDDNGRTWSDIFPVAAGDGRDDSDTCGYGDAAAVVDRKSGRILVLCCTARKGATCWTAAQRGAIVRSADGGRTWDKPVDIKDAVMRLLPADRVNYFAGSGKLCQSRRVKVGRYYRVYAAIWTTNGRGGDGLTDYVIYTDDFGNTWHLLGARDVRPVPGGDEPKVEELPDGSVVLNGRKPHGRYYNIFRYTDVRRGTGNWGEAVASDRCTGGIAYGRNSTNGELLVVPVRRTSDNRHVRLALQSVPTGDGRDSVSIYFKEVSAADCASPERFASHWSAPFLITPAASAYSTMALQADGRIAFFYEDGARGVWYDMVYLPLALEQITRGAYRPVRRKAGKTARATR